MADYHEELPRPACLRSEGQVRLRLAIELSLKGPDLFGCFKAHRQSPSPRQLRKHTRSQGPFLRRHYPASTVVRPCPTPTRSTAISDVEAATFDLDGSPPITRITIPTCCVQYPGRPNRCMCRLLPCPHGLPRAKDGSASASTLRGLLELHSRYSPLDRSTAQGGLCHEASARPVTQPNRSSASRSIDNCLDGICPPIGDTRLRGALFARIIAMRIDPGPPFSALLTLWLSMMAAIGLASRSSCSRHCTYSA